MNEVRLIAGKIPGNNTLRFWKVENKNIYAHIGDYAIVENIDSYALVEILGLLITTEQKALVISNNEFKRMKKVVKTIKAEELHQED